MVEERGGDRQRGERGGKKKEGGKISLKLEACACDTARPCSCMSLLWALRNMKECNVIVP